MASNLMYYITKIQEYQEDISFEDFVMGVTSWRTLGFCRNGKLISRYPESDRSKIIDKEAYFRDINIQPPLHNYDHNQSFFYNFGQFFKNYPFPNLWAYNAWGENVNSEFTDNIWGGKNVYLSVVTGGTVENIAYSSFVYYNVSDAYNCSMVGNNCSIIYQSFWVIQSSQVFYSRYIENSHAIWFSTNLVGCEECIFCDGLQNQKYHIRNISYTKEEYLLEKEMILKDKEKFDAYFTHLPKKAINYGSTNYNGNGVFYSDKIINGFLITHTQDAKNVMIGETTTEMSHIRNTLDFLRVDEHIYGCMGIGGASGSHIYLSNEIGDSHMIFYSMHCTNCSFLLGCIGLNNKQYCIFNKQYSKEEWEEKICEIFSAMEKDGTLGAFYPGSMNPYYFNDTVAGNIGLHGREEALANGYLWRDAPIRVETPQNAKIITVNELEDYERGGVISRDILSVVIKDEEGNYYKVIEMEYLFLNKHRLPLPRKHWQKRMKETMGFSS